ncbi:MAG TPA: efflux RND transporter periplasmic adaptor subunit [Xanthobacteraceae bacterium]|nr:efflux RND transporter periplasmic adaptor subunit [Xanthobacteraceae bacterium]
MKRILLGVLFVSVVACGYYYRGYLFEAGTETRAARPVAIQPVVADVAVEMPMPVQVSAIGSVQPIATVMIKSRVDGQIAQVHFNEGQEVKEGDVLFTLDDRALRAQLAQSEATLERDRASLQRAKLEVARQSGLATRGVASVQKFEDVETTLAVFEATARAAEAAVESARINLNYATIVAPINGRTGSVTLKKGNLVKATELSSSIPLVTITQLRPIYVTFTVPEGHLAELRAAAAAGSLPVAVTIPSQPQIPVTGTLVFIDNKVDVATGTITLKAEFSNDDTRLWPGQFVNVTLTLGVQANAVVVPSAAVQIGQNGPYVFVVRPDSTVELRLVRVDRTINGSTLIAEGLVPGEGVVVDGHLRLDNGTRVAAQKSERTPPPKPPAIPVAER